MQGKMGPLDSKSTTTEIDSVMKASKLKKSNSETVCNELLKCNPKAILPVLSVMFNFIPEFKPFQVLGIWQIINRSINLEQ